MLNLKETQKDARNRFDAAIDALDAKGVQDIRGLCAYAEGTGQSSAGTRYLLEECKAYEAAKGDYKLRRALRAQIVDVLSSIADAVEKQKGIVRPDTSILAEFESLEGGEASAFYREHKAELRRAQQSLRDSENNIN